MTTASTITQTQEPDAPMWMSAVLWLAAVYNVIWGVSVVALPNQIFEWVGMAPPNYVWLWQCLGMVIGVYGVGYALAAMRPYRHWPIVLVGLLGKIFGMAGFAWAYYEKTIVQEFGWVILANDVIWVIPFAFILHGAWRAQHPKARVTKPAKAAGDGEESADPEAAEADDEPHPHAGNTAYKAAEAIALSTATRQATLHQGHMLSALSLRELTDKRPALVIFLRHMGCTFCREALAEIAQKRKEIEASGALIVLVHMSPPNKAAPFFERYDGLDTPPIFHISDPDRRLYAAFELARGKFKQLFGLREFTRGFKAGIIKGHFLGLPKGDGRQLGGAFVYYRRTVVKAWRASRASEQADLGAMGTCLVGLGGEATETAGKGAAADTKLKQAPPPPNPASQSPPRGNPTGSSPGRR